MLQTLSSPLLPSSYPESKPRNAAVGWRAEIWLTCTPAICSLAERPPLQLGLEFPLPNSKSAAPQLACTTSSDDLPFPSPHWHRGANPSGFRGSRCSVQYGFILINNPEPAALSSWMSHGATNSTCLQLNPFPHPNTRMKFSQHPHLPSGPTIFSFTVSELELDTLLLPLNRRSHWISFQAWPVTGLLPFPHPSLPRSAICHVPST